MKLILGWFIYAAVTLSSLFFLLPESFNVGILIGIVNVFIMIGILDYYASKSRRKLEI